MALAPLVYTLWNGVMRFDPKDPIWPNRDRFVLSNGHASMLLWSVLHLTGTRAVNADYERVGHPAVTLDDIKHFRQLGSKAPGHPEYHLVSGVEATTGPLGQGIANSVGMAIARKWLATRYNKPGFEMFDYNIYAVCGDGCLMEGVGSEAASLAGHLGLDNLCWIYDNNHITIEGNDPHRLHRGRRGALPRLSTGTCCASATPTICERIEDALAVFRETKGRPTLIILDSHIGYGSPHKVDTAEAHGEPLGEEEVRLAKRAYGWPEDAKFLVPDGVIRAFRRRASARAARRRARLGDAVRRLSRAISRARDRDRADAAPRAAGGMGSESAEFSRRSKGHRRTRCLGPGAERAGAEHSLVSRRLGGPRAVEPDDAQIRRRRRFRAANARRPESAFRHSRARHGGDRQRAVAVEAAGVRRDVLHLQRLCAAGDPAFRADGAADDLRSSPMTPWATARMARRISRSSN